MYPALPVLALVASLAFGGCSSPATERGMYWWRTVYAPSAYEESRLVEAGVTRMYIRFFDVAQGEDGSGPAPVAPVQFLARPAAALHVVPVAYITVRALRALSNDSASMLGRAIVDAADRIAQENGIRYSELQLDCDWTPSVREVFFQLAAAARERLHARGGQLSVTLRLHQYRRPAQTGVPPADRGMLMDYNMGRMRPDAVENSIYRETDAKPYLEHPGHYPMPIDVVLPVFHWTLHFRGGGMAGILGKTSVDELRAVNGIVRRGDGLFVVDMPQRFRGVFLARGDVLKPEGVSPAECVAAARLLAKKLATTERTIALFECDSLYLTRYTRNDLEDIYTAFR
jgi:hypothetical protein